MAIDYSIKGKGNDRKTVTVINEYKYNTRGRIIENPWDSDLNILYKADSDLRLDKADEYYAIIDSEEFATFTGSFANFSFSPLNAGLYSPNNRTVTIYQAGELAFYGKYDSDYLGIIRSPDSENVRIYRAQDGSGKIFALSDFSLTERFYDQELFVGNHLHWYGLKYVRRHHEVTDWLYWKVRDIDSDLNTGINFWDPDSDIRNGHSAPIIKTGYAENNNSTAASVNFNTGTGLWETTATGWFYSPTKGKVFIFKDGSLVKERTVATDVDTFTDGTITFDRKQQGGNFTLREDGTIEEILSIYSYKLTDTAGDRRYVDIDSEDITIHKHVDSANFALGQIMHITQDDDSDILVQLDSEIHDRMAADSDIRVLIGIKEVENIYDISTESNREQRVLQYAKNTDTLYYEYDSDLVIVLDNVTHRGPSLVEATTQTNDKTYTRIYVANITDSTAGTLSLYDKDGNKITCIGHAPGLINNGVRVNGDLTFDGIADEEDQRILARWDRAIQLGDYLVLRSESTTSVLRTIDDDNFKRVSVDRVDLDSDIRNLDSELRRLHDSEIHDRKAADSDLAALIEGFLRYKRDSELEVSRLRFTNDSEEAVLEWSGDDKTLHLGLGTTRDTYQHRIGAELLIYGKIQAAVTKGTPLMFTGSEGDHLTFGVADATSATFKPEYIAGFAADNYQTNDFGYLVSEGKLVGLDTSGFNEGSLLYLSPDQAGVFIDSDPAWPAKGILLAAVTRSHANEGSIQARITVKNDLEDLHNVTITYGDSDSADVTTKHHDVLGWDSDLKQWTNVRYILEDLYNVEINHDSDSADNVIRHRDFLAWDSDKRLWNSTSFILEELRNVFIDHDSDSADKVVRHKDLLSWDSDQNYWTSVAYELEDLNNVYIDHDSDSADVVVKHKDLLSWDSDKNRWTNTDYQLEDLSNVWIDHDSDSADKVVRHKDLLSWDSDNNNWTSVAYVLEDLNNVFINHDSDSADVVVKHKDLLSWDSDNNNWTSIAYELEDLNNVYIQHDSDSAENDVKHHELIGWDSDNNNWTNITINTDYGEF